MADETRQADLTGLFDTVDYAEACRLPYLAAKNSFPGQEASKRDFVRLRAAYIQLVFVSQVDMLSTQDVARLWRRPRNEDQPRRAPFGGGWMSDPRAVSRQPLATLRNTSADRRVHAHIRTCLIARQKQVSGGPSTQEQQTPSNILKNAAPHAATRPS